MSGVDEIEGGCIEPYERDRKYKVIEMIILIDGYNVLKMVFPKALVDESQREKFIGQLSRYAHMTHNKLYVVFDGGEDSRPLFLQRRDITVVYSGYRDSADTVIKGLLEQEQKNEVLLISTDRELNRYAAHYDIPSMESLVFHGYVRDRLHAGEAASKRPAQPQVHKFTANSTSYDLDALMEEGSQKVFYKHDDEQGDGQQSSHKPKRMTSKLDKRLEKMVKKL